MAGSLRCQGPPVHSYVRRSSSACEGLRSGDVVVSPVCTYIDTPVGRLKLVADNGGLVAILWPGDVPRRVPLAVSVQDEHNPVLVETELQLRQYFAGERTSFALPMNLRGTPFQLAVWKALLAIPFGETRSYGELAQQLSLNNGARAVGAASGRNPVSIVVPCHRIVGCSGQLTGFAGGLNAKAYLLDWESSLRSAGQEKRPTQAGLFSPSAKEISHEDV